MNLNHQESTYVLNILVNEATDAYLQGKTKPAEVKEDAPEVLRLASLHFMHMQARSGGPFPDFIAAGPQWEAGLVQERETMPDGVLPQMLDQTVAVLRKRLEKEGAGA